jgi:transposase
MGRRRSFSKWQWHQIRVEREKARKRNRHDVCARLDALYWYRQGKSLAEIAEITGFNEKYISQLVTKFLNGGISLIVNDGRTETHNRRLSFEEEEEFLEQFIEQAMDGKLTSATAIHRAYEERTGAKCNKSVVYRMLKRHGWVKNKPRKRHPGGASQREIASKKRRINAWYKREEQAFEGEGCVRLMFGDEASFGRISEPTACWVPQGFRAIVYCQQIRQYKTAFGAVSPADGQRLFMVFDKCNTEVMNTFLKALAKKFPDDIIILCVDNASWHKSKDLVVPENIRLFYLPPRTPEMNPIEIVWREIRARGFRNELFPDIDAVVKRFFEVTRRLTRKQITSITLWNWIKKIVE